jgi:Mg2+ and Co2+ transporter CorA
LHHTGTATIRAPRSRGGDYVFGDFLVPLLLDDAAVLYREVDVVAAHDVVLTVRKTADVDGAFDCAAVRELHGAGHVQSTGMVVYHLVDDVAEGYLELTDRLNDRIDALEDHVADDWASARLSSLSRAKVAHDRAVVGGTRP